jgi:hypothetical protein
MSSTKQMMDKLLSVGFGFEEFEENDEAFEEFDDEEIDDEEEADVRD